MAMGWGRMKAIVQDRYGSADVLDFCDVARPEVGPADVLVKVVAAGLDLGAWHFMTGQPYLMRILGFGLRAPRTRIPGTNVAGRVEAVGRDVAGFLPGERVYGTCSPALSTTTTPSNRRSCESTSRRHGDHEPAHPAAASSGS